MQQKLTLQAKLQQKLILTPSLQQAIKLLPMSTLELADMLQQEITENPLLEEELERERSEAQEPTEATPEGSEERSTTEVTGEAQEQPKPEPEPEPEPDPKSDDSLNEIDYESFFSDYLDEGYRPRTAYEVPELPPIENTLSTTATLADHLHWQLRMTSMDDKAREIGEAIIGNIDEHGYLQASIEEICEMGDYQPDEEVAALDIVQAFDPVGVGARDLKECLLLQIAKLDLGETPLESMVSDHLDHLQNHRSSL